MSKVRSFVALDVHVAATVAAVLDAGSGELRRQRLSGRTGEVIEFVTGLEGPVRATYEAGPTEFALARRLQAAGVDCLVCAPGLIPRGPSDRVKTDQRDAERLVRLLVAGELHRVTVPRPSTPPERDADRAQSRSRDRGTPAGCWSRPPGTTASHHGSASRCGVVRPAPTRRSSRSPGRPNDDSITSGRGWSSAASAERSSRSLPRASSPGSAGRSRQLTDTGPTPRWPGRRRAPRPPSRQSIRDTPMSTPTKGNARC